jgi:purine-nucleoside phosphorylase
MQDYQSNVRQAADFLLEHLSERPQVGLLTGTGLAEMVSPLTISNELGYERIPHFPAATVPSHTGQMAFGHLKGIAMLVMQGRFHLYEGYSPHEVTFPIRVMQTMGVKVLIVTNAAGGLNPLFQAGDIMLIRDHINLTGHNPLRGPNVDQWGVRFPDMSAVYDRRLQIAAEEVGINHGFIAWKGVYAGLMGPSLETPAEIRYLRNIGAEAVGFSTIQEVIAAAHAGMRILGISTITNVANPDYPEPATVEEIIAVAQAAVPKLVLIVEKITETLHEEASR